MWSTIIVLLAVAEIGYYFIMPMLEQKQELTRQNYRQRVEFARERIKLRKEEDNVLLFERENGLEEPNPTKSEGK